MASTLSKKFCMIGDSHVGAFKLGWEAVSKDYPNVEMSFFATGRSSMKQLKSAPGKVFFSNPKLTAKVQTLTGHSEVLVDQFDTIFCVGMNNATHSLFQAQKYHGISGSSFPTKQVLSREAFIDTWIDRFEARPLANVLKRLGEAGAEDTIVILKPHPCETIIRGETKSDLRDLYQRYMSNEDERKLVWSVFEESIAKILPRSAKHFPQPIRTTVGNMLSKEEFSIGSVPLMKQGSIHEETDHKHMNAKYGEVFL